MSGEARSGVLEALQYACSQDPSVLKVGEERLKTWEKEKGFYTALSVRVRRFLSTAIHDGSAQRLLPYSRSVRRRHAFPVSAGLW